jgi:hypothetical protein
MKDQKPILIILIMLTLILTLVFFKVIALEAAVGL